MHGYGPLLYGAYAWIWTHIDPSSEKNDYGISSKAKSCLACDHSGQYGSVDKSNHNKRWLNLSMLFFIIIDPNKI